MPYIETEKVAEIRKALKVALPDFKLSVRRENHSAVRVAILKGPLEFEHKNVNPYWYHDHYQGEELEVITKIFQTMNSVEQKQTESEDSDYGSIPNYYQSVSIGTWDKPYVQAQK